MIELLNAHPVLVLFSYCLSDMSSPHRRRKVATLVSLRASVTTKRARLPACIIHVMPIQPGNRALTCLCKEQDCTYARCWPAFGGQQQSTIGRVMANKSFSIIVLLTAKHAAAMRLAT
jgi:hypothetical protein